MDNWFDSAKLGIFMHWGIYSVLGVTESWSFFGNEIGYDEYMNQLSGFTAEKYNPDEWAELFKKAGARYAVLTSKHHDGVALWDTKTTDLNVVKKTPVKRDLVAPYCEAMRNHGLKVGLYYSHLDWNQPDYASIHPESTGWWAYSKYCAPPEGVPNDYERWERFLQFHKQQLTELLENYGKIDLMWFDGVWERTAEQWKFKQMREYIRKISPDTMVNERIGGYGDYKCPEVSVPILPPEGRWELCYTMNDSWGYKEQDKNYKSLRQIVRTFTECIGMGGNLLLDIGPKADGTICEEQKNLLLGIGKWIDNVSEAIYETQRGLPFGHFYGASTLSKDKRTLYLFVYDIPVEGICVKGIQNEILDITALNKKLELTWKRNGAFLNMPGQLWIDVPGEALDDVCTVIKLELKDELSLYRGKGGGITA